MKTLSDILRDADPLTQESRSPQARSVTRARVLSAPLPSSGRRAFSRPQVLALAAVFSLAVIAAGVFGWRHTSVDAVAAVQFEARLAESNQTILRNADILTARMVQGSKPSTFGVALTFTPEGAEKMRHATETHVGEHLQLLIDNDLVMSPLIRGAIAGAAELTGDYTHAEAARIIDGLFKSRLELRNEQ